MPLFLPFEQVRRLPIVQKYKKIFTELDLSHISEFNRGIGANGTSQQALVRAFIIRSLESLKIVPALIRFLNTNPALIYLCGFQKQILSDESQFYLFLKNTKHSMVEGLLFKANKTLIAEDVIALKTTAVDSKPVRALTKHNNLKNPHRNQKNKKT